MGKGMKSGDWTEAADQIFKADSGLDKIWIPDTISTRKDDVSVTYEATKRSGGQKPKLKKHHYPEKRRSR